MNGPAGGVAPPENLPDVVSSRLDLRLTDVSITLSGFVEAKLKCRQASEQDGTGDGWTLTLDVELHGGVGHPHHVLGDAGQLVVVVVSADVEEGEVDGVGGGLDVRLQQDRRGQREREREDT